MDQLNLKLNNNVLEELSFYCKVLSLFENTETITEIEIKKKVQFYSQRSKSILNEMTDQGSNDSTNNHV